MKSEITFESLHSKNSNWERIIKEPDGLGSGQVRESYISGAYNNGVAWAKAGLERRGSGPEKALDDAWKSGYDSIKSTAQENR